MLAVLSNELSFSLSHGSEFIRLNLLRNGLRFFIETFGFGTGAGNIEYWMVHKAKFYVGGVELIHNWWAEILVGYGLFVFIGYVIVYIRMAIALYHSYLKSNDKFFMSTSLSLFCVMSAFSISAVSSSSNISAEWLWLFWGVVITYIGLVERTVDTVDYR
jgi:teichuronic acid biosynthesis protein TuaE